MSIPSNELEVMPWHRLSIYIACTLAALIANYLLGKDMAWDTLNYHFYAGFSALHDRFSQDYFAAGPQSYFNPFAYVPFYALVRAGFSPLVVGSVLASLHSIILWATFEIAVAISPSEDRHTRIFFGISAVMLTLFNPILLQQIGSSFADITTAELVLVGWMLLAGGIRVAHIWRIVIAGLMIGSASALKLTNAVHAISAFALFLMLPVAYSGKIRLGLYYAASLAIGFACVAAPWAFRLERMFGNPFFPLMNGVFRSPEFTTESIRHFRFIPENIVEALWRPFAIVDPMNMVYEELRAPDLRYAVLTILAVAYISRRLFQHFHVLNEPSTRVVGVTSDQVFKALGYGFAADWILWLSASGNGRYFLPMTCIAAVLIVGLVFRLFATMPKVRNYTLAAVLILQVIQLSMGTDFRWSSVTWDSQWLDVKVPKSLATEPDLFLTIGAQSNSFIAPFLADGAGLVNYSGGYPLGNVGANGFRVKALIDRYSPHVRVLMEGERMYANGDNREPYPAEVDFSLNRFNLRVDIGNCATISVRGAPPTVQIATTNTNFVDRFSAQTTNLVSCGVLPANKVQFGQMDGQRVADLAFDHLEDACPKLFQPRRPYTDAVRQTWMRSYINTDLVVWVRNDSLKMLQPLRGDDEINLGHVSDWAKKASLLDCGRRNGHFYVRFLGSKVGG